MGTPSTWDDALATRYGPPVNVNGPLLSVSVLPLPGVICIIELDEANAALAALNDAGAKLTDTVNASEQNATASKSLRRLEVKVEKPETVRRRRNMVWPPADGTSGKTGRVDWLQRQTIVETAKYVFLL